MRKETLNGIEAEIGIKTEKLEFVTFEEAKKLSVIKSKHLEEHLLMRLREYQVSLLNAIINPKFYDYDKDYLVRSITSVLNQLKTGIS